MLLRNPIESILFQIRDLLQELTDDEYTRSCKTLFNATIGQHVRHIIELFQCLETGYRNGLVNYDKRKRDPHIETEREFAMQCLEKICSMPDRSNREITLEAEYDGESNGIYYIPSNYYRELTYNLEHAIHHMALIRVGVNEVSTVTVPDEFGVAYSTIKFRQQCAQ